MPALCRGCASSAACSAGSVQCPPRLHYAVAAMIAQTNSRSRPHSGEPISVPANNLTNYLVSTKFPRYPQCCRVAGRVADRRRPTDSLRLDSVRPVFSQFIPESFVVMTDRISMAPH